MTQIQKAQLFRVTAERLLTSCENAALSDAPRAGAVQVLHSLWRCVALAQIGSTEVEISAPGAFWHCICDLEDALERPPNLSNKDPEEAMRHTLVAVAAELTTLISGP